MACCAGWWSFCNHSRKDKSMMEAENLVTSSQFGRLWSTENSALVITKHHRWLNRNLLPIVLAVWKPKIKGPANSVLLRMLFLACQRPPSFCVLTWQREQVLLSLPLLGLQPPQVRPHFNYLLTFITFSQSLSPNTIILRFGASTHKFAGNKNIQSISAIILVY